MFEKPTDNKVGNLGNKKPVTYAPDRNVRKVFLSIFYFTTIALYTIFNFMNKKYLHACSSRRYSLELSLSSATTHAAAGTAGKVKLLLALFPPLELPLGENIAGI
jgi:hypothetical protein